MLIVMKFGGTSVGSAERIAEAAKLAVASVEQLPFVEDTFDAVMSVHTLYFWADLKRALTDIARVLRSDGRLDAGKLRDFFRAIH